VSRADFDWSDQRPDSLVLKGVLHDSQTFPVNYTRHAVGRAHDVSEDLEEDDGEDVPDFSFWLLPKHDHDAGDGGDGGDGGDDGASGDGRDCDIPVPAELAEAFGPQPEASNPDLPPPLNFYSGSDADEDLESWAGEDSSEMGTDSDLPPLVMSVPQPPTPCAFDRDIFSREPASFTIDQDASAHQGRIFEMKLHGGLGRCLGSQKMIGTSSVKVQCSICKHSSSGDLLY